MTIRMGLHTNAYLYDGFNWWKRLLLCWIYIPYLIWCYFWGTPLVEAYWEEWKKGRQYISVETWESLEKR